MTTDFFTFVRISVLIWYTDLGSPEGLTALVNEFRNYRNKYALFS